MKTQCIAGWDDLVSSRLSYGCMRVSGSWEPSKVTPDMVTKGKESIIAAYEAGYILFDHADIYGRGVCETIHGEAMREVSGMRDSVLIATKCGIRFPGEPNPDSPHRFDFSAEHIVNSCEGSLKRLGIDRIDIYQLHRPDFLMNPEEIAEAFHSLHSSGKVRHFGVSNFSPSQFALLQHYCDFGLVVNQVEIHLGRLDCFTDGTLDQCLERNVTPLSWSPLVGGAIGTDADPKPDHPRFSILTAVRTLLDELGEKYGVSRSCVALAWLLKHPSKIIPIVGSTNCDHIREAVKADDVDLSREDWYRLLVAARGEPLP